MKKNIISIIMAILILGASTITCFAAVTIVNNTSSNVLDTYPLAYGNCNSVYGRATMANTSDYTFWAMTVAGKIVGNNSVKEVLSAVHGPSNYTKTIKVVTYYASNTNNSISNLSTNGFVSGVQDGNYCNYVDMTYTFSNNIVCTVTAQALLSSSSGYRSYPSITTGC